MEHKFAFSVQNSPWPLTLCWLQIRLMRCHSSQGKQNPYLGTLLKETCPFSLVSSSRLYPIFTSKVVIIPLWNTHWNPRSCWDSSLNIENINRNSVVSAAGENRKRCSMYLSTKPIARCMVCVADEENHSLHDRWHEDELNKSFLCTHYYSDKLLSRTGMV